ncbi:MAG: ABC transporter ATP-binding protein [archaeon GBS-70-058]|nr:ABC transporter ATP-binding protein [Candidatus Culexarchaeum nevadense]
MSKPIVETENLVKVYKHGKIEVHALRGITVKMPNGKIIGLVGPSGSGKTTLLNIIGGLDMPTKGKIYVDGIDLTKLSEKRLAEYRLNKIGFVFQFLNLIPVLTALENIEVPMILAKIPKEERRKRAIELLKMVGLEDRMNHKPDEMSGGEQQRVAIARALANNPSIVLADEPTGNVDTDTTIKIMEIIVKLNRSLGKTFIIATHDPIVKERCEKIYNIRDGKLVGEEA